MNCCRAGSAQSPSSSAASTTVTSSDRGSGEQRSLRVDAGYAGQVRRRDRDPRRQVLVELQRAHRLGLLGANMGDQADIRRGHEARELPTGYGRVHADVGECVQRLDRTLARAASDQRNRALRPGIRDGAYRDRVDPLVEGADIEHPRPGKVEEPGGRRPRLDPFGRLDPVRDDCGGPAPDQPLSAPLV